MQSRTRISSDFFLIIVSLFIATAIWLIAKASDITTEYVSPIQVEAVNVPENLEIDYPKDGVIIEVQYPKAQKRFILPSKFKAVIDVKAENIIAGAGTDQAKPIQYPLSIHNIQLQKDLPQGIKVIAIRDPKNLWIQAKLLTVPAKINPIIVGDPGAGYEYKRAIIEGKDQILLTGTKKSIQEALSSPTGTIEIKTEPIDISGKTDSFLKNIKLEIPEPYQLVMNEAGSISINIVIEEKNALKVMKDVPVNIFAFSENLVALCKPAAVDVTVEGPISSLEKLTNDSFVFNTKQPVIEAEGDAGNYAIEAKFSDNADSIIKEKAKITSVKPGDVLIEFKVKGQEGAAKGE